MNNVLPADTVSGTIDVGVSFSNVGVEGGAFTIGDTLFDTPVANGDVCLIFNPSAYNYDWYEYATDTGAGEPGWMITDMETFDMKTVSSFEVKSGASLVFIPYSASGAVTVSGEVADLKGASRVFNINLAGDPDETMFPISNPYPIDTTVKMLSDFVVNGDVLLIWNDSAYNYDWCEFANDTGDGNPGWMITDMETFDMRTLTNDNDIVLAAGHGAILIPYVGGVRTWTIALEK